MVRMYVDSGSCSLTCCSLRCFLDSVQFVHSLIGTLKTHSSALQFSDQIILLGCEEGIYSLNTAQIHEGVMDQIFQRRTTWIYVINNIMMSLSGMDNSITSILDLIWHIC